MPHQTIEKMMINKYKQCEFGVPYSQTNLFLEHQDALDQFVEAAQSQGLIVALACFSQKRQNCVCPKIGETPMAILTSENDDKTLNNDQLNGTKYDKPWDFGVPFSRQTHTWIYRVYEIHGVIYMDLY